MQRILNGVDVYGNRIQRILKGHRLEDAVPAIYQAAGQDKTLERWARSLQRL